MTQSSPSPPLLDMRGIRKSFLGVPALAEASFQVNRGEVRALIGQNGAGKSTLIKVLTGVYKADGGTVTFDGRPVAFDSPHAAQLGGIATIYQEVNLVPYRTVTENIFLGRERRRFGLLDWRRMNAEARELLAGLDVHVDVTRPLREFSIATQQMTAIARALSFDAKLVIMDEPTSSLAEHEVSVLFDVIRRLRDSGVSVVFVSHRLDELYAVCDRVTIMRDGRTVDDRAMADISKYELVSKMIGRDLAEVRRAASRAPHQAEAAPVIEASGLELGQALRGVDVAVRSGEIVGLAGLLGSGRSETARVLFGADAPDSGEVRVDAEPVRFAVPRDAIRRGIGFSPEDRKVEGIIPQMSVRENLTLALLPRLTKAGIVDRRRQQQIVERFIERIGIKVSSADQPIRELSGGNQQKVLLARWLCMNPRLLVLDEPTRGIDVGAKQEIQSLIRELADDGLGVLFISSELEELVENADRVVVLRDGRNVAELRGDQISEERIMAAMAHGAAVEAEDGAR
ncbi:sugar ABC transporter ATP-binding protein [Thermoactinospora rubra]|uniref:sugar ABC transporter ATP-binding protein n=1 Tax=Thermoactinospora rubra TaxID=1088767 RepID=UPI000A0FAC0A|nr:sugar ABC transporter ATP-binding protein [Thermoactinospora rubra]